MKRFTLIFHAEFPFFRCNVWKLFAIVALSMSCTATYAGGYHTYLDEGHLLVDSLKNILIEEHVCASVIDCQSQGGHAFLQPLKRGVAISVYGIKSNQVAARLLQACVASFATRPLGSAMTAEIFPISILERNSQSAFSKTPATFTLKLEKTDVNH